MKLNLIASLTVALSLASSPTLHGAKPWKAAKHETVSAERSFQPTVYGNPFSGSDRSILDVVSEVSALNGIKLPVTADGRLAEHELQLTFGEKGLLLIAAPDLKSVEALGTNGGKIIATPLLKNAVSVTELPALNIYGIRYDKGTYPLSIPAGAEPVIIMGATCASQKFSGEDMQLKSGVDYPAFAIEGFSEKPALFTIIGGPDKPVIDEGMPGTESIFGGFEGGQMIKVGDTYHIFPTERAGEDGQPAKYDRIKTRIGHWTSKDAVNWDR